MTINRNYEEFEASSYEHSTWQNPTEQTVTFRVWRGPESSQKPWLYLSIPPGQERSFPSEYDDSIHTKDKNGIIVGGLAPQLVKKGVPHRMDPVLDTHLQERKRALDNAARALAEKTVSEQAAILAAAQIKAAEEASMASQKLHDKISMDKRSVKELKELQEKMIDERLAAKGEK